MTLKEEVDVLRLEVATLKLEAVQRAIELSCAKQQIESWERGFYRELTHRKELEAKLASVSETGKL